MENNLMKSNLKKLEFPNQTPQRSGIHTNEFYSSQKVRPEGSYRPVTQSTSTLVLNPEIYNSQEDLYEQIVPMRVRSFDREEHDTYLHIKMSMLNPSSVHSHILHLEVTDENNHLFLYVLDMNETDYFNLKSELNLHVDFSKFPKHFQHHIDQCGSGSDENKPLRARFDIKNNEGFLIVQQTNEFQTLSFLNLKLREATDTVLKNYLARRLAHERAFNDDLRRQNDGLQSMLQQKCADFERAQHTLTKIRDDHDNRVNELLNDERRKLNDEKEAAVEKVRNLTNDFETKRRELTNEHEKRTRELTNKLEHLGKANQELTETKFELESSVRDLRNKLNLTEKENQQLQRDLETTRLGNKELESLKFTHEKQITELRVKVEGLEAQVRNKEELAQKHNELFDNASKQKSMLEETVSEYKKKIEKLEDKLNLCTEEIKKGNEIIEKFQSDISQQKQKTKMKNALIQQQEENITKLQAENDKLNKDITTMQREANKREFDIQDLEKKLEEATTNLQHSANTIKENQDMIAYLNQKITQQQGAGLARMPFSNKMIGASTTTGMSYSPYKMYGGDNEMGNSMKISTSINMDKYKHLTHTADQTSYSKTLGGNFHEKGGLTANFETNYNKTSGIYDPVKENLDYSNRSFHSINHGTNQKSHAGANEFNQSGSIDISTHNMGIQPIKYVDPQK